MDNDKKEFLVKKYEEYTKETKDINYCLILEVILTPILIEMMVLTNGRLSIDNYDVTSLIMSWSINTVSVVTIYSLIMNLLQKTNLEKSMEDISNELMLSRESLDKIIKRRTRRR